MIRHGLTGPPASSDPSDAVLSGIYPLYFRDEFLGSCIAIAPRILITAGHHFNSLKDDVGDLHLLDAASEGEITVAYVSKDRVHDLLVLWVSADLNWVPLRGFQPPVGARVATVWLSTKWPHDTIVSPGTVIEVNRGNCVVRGTVSTTGSSGSPVVDQFGDHIVGMHLISNTRDGSRVSGFISSRMIVSALVAMGVPCREVESNQGRAVLGAYKNSVMVSEGTSAAGRLEGESPLALRVDTGEIVAGCLAGFVEHFFMFPFDTLKTRVQSGDSTNVILAAKRISRNERLAHLYRGFAPIIVSAVPAHGAYYSTYEAAKRVFGEDSTVSITVSASCAVAAHDTISTPFDVIKQRMQMDGSRKFASSLQCGQCAVAEGGVRCLLLSLPTTILMNIPHFSAYWLVYEGFLAYLGGERRNRETEVAGDYITGGLLAGSVASIVSSPLDVVKTQLQLGLRKNIPDAVRYVLANRGTKGFFAGVTARVMCTAPAGALSMITYETAKKFMEER